MSSAFIIKREIFLQTFTDTSQNKTEANIDPVFHAIYRKLLRFIVFSFLFLSNIFSAVL